ncbi:MAG: HNH endonuclease [Desulfobacteraceae bacterium]|nr:MAG: HNH endonuclease [Desulfobacteraceae bacterium]
MDTVSRNTLLHDPFSIHLEDNDIKREKQKARELRKSQWWKRKCAKGICGYCNQPTAPGDLTMDHMIPISRGGKSVKGNVIPCCKECNNRKKELLPLEWEQFLSDKKSDQRGSGDQDP